MREIKHEIKQEKKVVWGCPVVHYVSIKGAAPLQALLGCVIRCLFFCPETAVSPTEGIL